jgi:undecaprenol kinase/diacylglycerol kinase (ATP)
MRHFLWTRARSFRYAFDGWWYVTRSQPNTWIHAAASLAVVLISLWLKLTVIEWALILIAITMVWTVEFLNTALEAAVDLASPEQHSLAKISKDVGAAAVLIASAGSVLIGLLVLGPPLWQRLQGLLAN